MTPSQESLPSQLPSKYVDEVQRCLELLHWYGLRHHVRMIFLCADCYQLNDLLLQDPLPNLVVPHINVICPLVITLILR